MSVFFVLAILIYVGYDLYARIFTPNVSLGNKGEEYFYIHTGSNYQQVLDSLVFKGYVINRNSFDWVAEKKNYKNKIKPGRYRLISGMNNAELVNLLRSGEQEMVQVVINNIQNIYELSGFLSANLELDSIDLLSLLSKEDTLSTYGYNSDNVMCLFLPNTYEFRWNTSAYQFFKRMVMEHRKFWDEAKLNKLKTLNLSAIDVCVLASIVQRETVKNDEKPLVAGVYMNRLKRDMPLQSDPTLIYILQDPSIRRVLNVHKELDSPYNTYKYIGLPPGPITLPDQSSLKSVLKYQKHDYLFFCAKPDFSGYHNFSQTYEQHRIFAKQYQYSLDTSKIFK